MIQLSEVFMQKYPKTAKRVMAIFSDANNGCECEFANITKPTLYNFVDSLCSQVATSSAHTYTAQFKSIINMYQEECNLSKGWEKILSVKNDVSEQIYLTDDELSRVIGYIPDTLTEAVVHQQFVLACLIGARHGDITKLTVSNIRDGYVCYVSEKTHIKAQVPLCPVAERILMGQFAYGDTVSWPFAYREKVCDNTFNDTLRRICKLCDIDEEITLYKRGRNKTAPKWTFASSHLGRRTCASLLYLHGCDIYTISRILAHKSVEMTAQKYIMCPIRTLSEETMSYFRQFG